MLLLDFYLSEKLTSSTAVCRVMQHCVNKCTDLIIVLHIQYVVVIAMLLFLQPLCLVGNGYGS